MANLNFKLDFVNNCRQMIVQEFKRFEIKMNLWSIGFDNGLKNKRLN